MNQRPQFHTRSALQLGLGALTLMAALLLAGLFLNAARGEGAAMAQPAMHLTWLAGLGALACLPPMLLAVRRLAGKPLPANGIALDVRWARRLMLIWPLVLLAGFAAASLPMAEGLLAPLGLLGLALPLAAAYALFARGLRADSAQRGWGVISFGYAPGLFIVILIEVLFILTSLVALVLVLSLSPQVLEDLLALAESAANPAALDMQALIRQAEELLRLPVVQALALLLVGVLMPLVEEIFKLLALWSVLRRGLSARTGFLLGMLAGGVFGFVESGVAISQFFSAGEWTAGVALRAATALLHLMLSALAGYGLGAAVEQKSAKPFLKMLLFSVALHGVWNAAAVLQAFSELSGAGLQAAGVTVLSTLVMLAAWGLLLKRVLDTSVILRAAQADVPPQTE